MPDQNYRQRITTCADVLVDPDLLRFPPDALQVLFLEVHEASIVAVEQVIDHLEIRDSVIAVVQADATTFVVPEAEQYDILLSETMQRGLEKEPQVAIVRNLLPQLRSDAVLIPQEIRLALSFVDLRIDTDLSRRQDDQGVVFTLSADRVRSDATHVDGTPGPLLAAVQPEIRRDRLPGESLFLTTEIDVYGEHGLRLNDAGITTPLRVSVPDRAGTTVTATYVLGDTPHLELTTSERGQPIEDSDRLDFPVSSIEGDR